MKHFSIAAWVDFARGLTPEPDSRLMTAHITEGCSECREMAEFFERLNGICQDMATTPVPNWAVREAKAVFPIRPLVKSKRVPRIPAVLIYDSLMAPEPLGLRSTWQVGWQALYEAGECSLDLRVEPQASSSRAALIGQISNHLSPATMMENIPVFLKSGRSVVAETRSNQFGEFQLEYEQQGRLQLCVYLESGTKRFQVPLKKFTSERLFSADRIELAPEGPNGEQA